MQIQQDSFVVYRPCPLECFNSSVEKLSSIFSKRCVVTEMIPYPKLIRDGILWVDSHGLQCNGRAGYLLSIDKKTVCPDYQKYLYETDSKAYLSSACLPTMFDVHKSIIILDNCYSSEVSIDTLTKWKDNMIFTTGYIRDYYDSQSTGMIKAIEVVMERLAKEKGISHLSYRIVKENKDFINKVFSELNAKYKTQYNLF